MRSGDIALVQFPYAEMSGAKLRPVLILNRIPGEYEDWLVCMVSTRIDRMQDGFDERIAPTDPDFQSSGLKADSIIRIGRLLVVEADLLPGSIGQISSDRLSRIRRTLSEWLLVG